MKQLIINADDFGIHPSVNEAVRSGAAAGRILSASFMSVGNAAAEAAAIAREIKSLGTGIHLTLVAERPVLPVEKVRSLVDEEGRFFPDYGVFIRRFLCGKINVAEVAAECEAQVAKMERLGLEITHLDSHQHLHVLPQIVDICLGLMAAHHIRRMRIPAEDYTFLGAELFHPVRFFARGGLTCLARCASVKARKKHIQTTDAFFGMLSGGHLEQKYFSAILQQLPEGVSEIMLHPGMDNQTLATAYAWQYHWQQEWEAAVSETTGRLLRENKIEVGSYRLLS